MTDDIVQEPAFLGVEQSFTGRRWVARPADSRLTLALAQRLGLPEILARVLAARGIDIDAAQDFLTPTLRAAMPDPSRLCDMDQAAARLVQAITQGQRIAVFGDYDVDGATSTALLVRFLRMVGADCTLYIPDRLAEGYGPNGPALVGLAQQGVKVAVTVDCGITAFDPLAAAAQAGLDVIVVDHHQAEPALPQAVAIVNPNRLDDPMTAQLGRMAAVGVAFLLAVAVNRALRQAGYYQSRPEPDLMRWLDLVALGTVCDVVPLTGINRALTAQGLKVLAGRSNPGIAALADIAGVTERMDAYHAGFVLGPRVNAGGRVGQADLGARLLITDDPVEAKELAARLHDLNAERRAIEAAVLEEAMALVEAAPPQHLVLVAQTGWHPGVIGIVASRLKERYGLPTCVVALDGGLGKASGRSIRGIDLGAAVIAARQSGLLVNGGGHAMAAGFTVAQDRLDDLTEFLRGRICDQQQGRGIAVPTLNLDGALSVAAANPDLLQQLQRLAPYGTGNSEPRFAIADARLVRADIVGASHVRCLLTAQGAGGSHRLKAIAFRAVDTPLGDALLRPGNGPLHLAGTLRWNRWNGIEEPQLLIDDAASASGGDGA